MPLDEIPAIKRPENDTAAPARAVLDAADRAALLDAVQAFSRQQIAARRTHPESPLTGDQLQAIADAARDSGLLDAGAEGIGLWSALAYARATPDANDARDSDTRDPGVRNPGARLGDGDDGAALSLAALQCLAADDAAAAWHLHGLALAQTAMTLAGIAPADGAIGRDTVFMPDGAVGIGRSAFGRLLAGLPLQASDSALLADNYGARARTAMVAPGTSRIAALRWQNGGMHLEIHDLAGATLTVDRTPHGLDGCHAVQWRAGPSCLAAAPLDRAALDTLIAAQQLAQVAMARGSLVPALRRAHDYARLRKQGGRIIGEHDAVAQLLAELETTTATVDRLLHSASTHMPTAAEAFALRREAMPLLARAANAAMQVHGGIGYMRDTGIEHILRTVNTLRLLGGSPAELALVTAAMTPHDSGLAIALPEIVAHHTPDHLPGHLPTHHPLSPATAFLGIPLVRALAPGPALDPWEHDTRTLPGPLARLRRRVRAFAERECAPVAAQVDREQYAGHTFSPTLQTLVQRAARAGLLTDLLPAPLGSAPPAQFLHALAWQQALRVEELARVDGGLMLLLSAHALGVCPLLLSGNVGLLRRVVLPAFRRTQAGDPQIFAFAITEPASGSDAEDGHGALQQSPGVRARPARRNGKSGWLLRGRKVFISGGDIARYVSVFAALDGEGYDSWTCFLVDAHTPGFRVARCEMKMGMRASGAAELEFDDCFVPDDMIAGGLRNGWALARATLNLSRLPVAAMAVGFAQQAVDIATDHACRETLAGRPLIHYQQVQSTLADLQAETGAIRQLVWHHARRWRPRQDGAALCKFQATDRAQVVIETAMDLLGNAAVRHDQRIERAFRDVRLTRIFEGTNQINRLAVIEDQQALLLARITPTR